MNSEIENNILEYNSEVFLDNKRKYLLANFNRVRSFTESLCENLETEDYVIQSMPDISPTKWHLAHTSWFFEEFVLFNWNKSYKPFNKQFSYLFNSYYVQVGERWFRPNRGLLARPTVKEVYAYRKYINECFTEFINTCDENIIEEMFVTINIGLHHEQQHQELLLTDIKHVFSMNPLYPEFTNNNTEVTNSVNKLSWNEFSEGVYEIGYKGKSFFYDNEKPVHKRYVQPFAVSSRLVTNEEYIEFINDNGYSKTELWLSEGSAKIEMENWNAPMYWNKEGNEWFNFTLNGYKKVNMNEPVCHVSFYEAEAFARWASARLATEDEWEIASNSIEEIKGNFSENKLFQPTALSNNDSLAQMFGDVWEWTRSDYSPYPGYQIPDGAIGEYNGKFMSGQYVLRGGSCATSITHIRNTYRNFFPPHARWQFMGIRLTKDI